MKPESLIFDIDGTLWDSRALVAEGYNEVLNREGYPELCVDAEDLKKLFGKTMTEIADILLATVPEEKRYGIMDQCMEVGDGKLLDDPCDIGYPGVVETLEELSKRYRLFIVSNSQRGYPETTMDKLGIGHLIEGHMCFGDTGTDKGTTIRILMERHNIRSAVYIGDTQGDYEASCNAGLPFVWVSYGFGVPEGYAYKADSFPELAEIF